MKCHIQENHTYLVKVLAIQIRIKNGNRATSLSLVSGFVLLLLFFGTALFAGAGGGGRISGKNNHFQIVSNVIIFHSFFKKIRATFSPAALRPRSKAAWAESNSSSSSSSSRNNSQRAGRGLHLIQDLTLGDSTEKVSKTPLEVKIINKFIVLTKNSKIQQKREKNCLPDGESNPGLPRDRRGYLPLYYRGLAKMREKKWLLISSIHICVCLAHVSIQKHRFYKYTKNEGNRVYFQAKSGQSQEEVRTSTRASRASPPQTSPPSCTREIRNNTDLLLLHHHLQSGLRRHLLPGPRQRCA